MDIFQNRHKEMNGDDHQVKSIPNSDDAPAATNTMENGDEHLQATPSHSTQTDKVNGDPPLLASQ